MLIQKYCIFSPETAFVQIFNRKFQAAHQYKIALHEFFVSFRKNEENMWITVGSDADFAELPNQSQLHVVLTKHAVGDDSRSSSDEDTDGDVSDEPLVQARSRLFSAYL